MTNPDTLYTETVTAATEEDAVDVAIRYIEWWEAKHTPISDKDRSTSIENVRQTWLVTQMFKEGSPQPEPWTSRTPEQYMADYAKEEAQLAAIRARKTVQVGMSIPVLMKMVVDSKKFTKGERAAIADRCFMDSPLDRVTAHKLRQVIIGNEQWQLVVERLRLKGG